MWGADCEVVVEEIDLNEDTFANDNDSYSDENEENTKSQKNEIYTKSKLISDENKKIRDKILDFHLNQKEINENNFSTKSENKEIVMLKNLNTNDTTSLRSSENSYSINYFHLDYSVNKTYKNLLN